MQHGWMELATVIVTNLAAILIAFAILISVIKGNFKILNEKVDGHISKMIDAVKEASKVEGKVDALMNDKKTTIIEDRRNK